MQHNDKTSWHSSTTLCVLFRKLDTTFHQGLRASTSLGAYIVARDSHVSSEFGKESDRGTSVASDPARGDPYNEHLMATAPEMILYI